MRKLIALLFLTGVIACKNPRNAALPNDPSKWDIELKDVVQKLDSADRMALLGYMMRAKLGEAFGGTGVPSGMTVGRAIDEQRKWAADQEQREREQKALAEKVERERQMQMASLRAAVNVALVSKGFQNSDYSEGRFQEGITIVLAFENKTGKDIVGVKGSAVFSDIFGDVIQRVGVKYDEDIPAGRAKRWSGIISYNQFMDKDVKLRNTELSKLKFDFEPLIILFKDGSKLEVPDSGT